MGGSLQKHTHTHIHTESEREGRRRGVGAPDLQLLPLAYGEFSLIFHQEGCKLAMASERGGRGGGVSLA